MLSDMEATYIVKDGSLVFTTPHKEKDTLSPRLYPVEDLIGDNEHAAVRDCRRLIEVTKATVLPDSWDDYGGSCTMNPMPPGNPRALLVSAHHGMHEAVQEFLDMLRLAKSADPKNVPVSIGRPISAMEKKIAAALKSPTSVNFEKTSFDEAMRSLAKQHGIAIVVDCRALDDFGVDPATPFWRKMDDVPLEEVLRSMLDNLELTYRIKHEVLLITTLDEHSQCLDVRAYPLAGVMPQPRRKYKARERYADKLVKTLHAVIEPESWDVAGAMGVAQPLLLEDFDVLIVSQLPEIHEQIGGLLSREEFRHAKWIRKKDMPPKIPPGGMGGTGGGMF